MVNENHEIRLSIFEVIDSRCINVLFETTSPVVVPEIGETIQIVQRGEMGWSDYKVIKRQLNFDASTNRRIELVRLYVKKIK